MIIKLAIFYIAVVVSACSINTQKAGEVLPPVKAYLEQGLFTIDGCPQIIPSKFGVIHSFATAQEAILAGYRPPNTSTCFEIVDKRVAKEREIFGEIQSTPQIEDLKAQLMLSQKIRALENENEELKSNMDNKVDKR